METAIESRESMEAGRKESTKLGVDLPAVYRDRGYLLLVFSERAGLVSFTRSDDMAFMRSPTRNFASDYSFLEQISPAALALNLIGRSVRGFPMKAKVRRRIIAMLDREALERLSNEVLAREYSKICSVQVSSISPDRRDAVIDELLEKLGDSIDTSDIVPTEEVTSSTNSEGASEMGTAQAAASTASKSAGKKPATKAAAASKPPKPPKSTNGSAASATYPASNKENPFREGTMKAKGWAIFAKGGERAKIIEAINKLGTTPSTASSWCHTYQKYAASSEGPKKKVEKPAKTKAAAKTASGKAAEKK